MSRPDDGNMAAAADPGSEAPASQPPLSQAAMAAMTILGMDWGARRIGLAIKPAGQDWALPSRVLTVRDEPSAIQAVREAIGAGGVQAVVAGLPLHADPAQAAQVRRFCRKAREHLRGVRWFFVDESLTTQQADTLSVDRPSHKPTDDLAAALILETFIRSCR